MWEKIQNILFCSLNLESLSILTICAIFRYLTMPESYISSGTNSQKFSYFFPPGSQGMIVRSLEHVYLHRMIVRPLEHVYLDVTIIKVIVL